jgi:pSer/pThr/pTyr-binding forkhead associated (FHA) protein
MSGQPIGFLLGAGTRPLPLVPGAVVTLGRDPQSSVPIDDALASRRHGCIDCGPRGVEFRDLGSRNGTFLNGQRLTAERGMLLRSGDQIRIGGKIFYFLGPNTELDPRRVAQVRTQRVAEMQTLDSDYFFRDGQVVKREEVAAPPVEQTQVIPQRGAATPALAGTLGEGTLPQIMQFIHAAAMTGKLNVVGPKLTGAVVFQNGQLHAATAGSHSGPEAVYECVAQQEGHFSFERMENADTAKIPQTITENTVQVIFECCRRMDEAAAGAST